MKARKKLNLLSLVFGITAAGLRAADTVKASSFGFSRENATKCLQDALHSGAKKVIIDNVGWPWNVEPIMMVSNQEVVLEDGVELVAIKGAFKDTGDCLIRFWDVKNVILRGEGNVVLRMHKEDYSNPDLYKIGEWRMALYFGGAENIEVNNLTVDGSGGDGVYITGSTKLPASKNVRLSNLICKNHYRQGISVISAEDFHVKNCSFIQTSGTPPTCGIDIEPNHARNRVINNVFENCHFDDNPEGCGINLYLCSLDASTLPISVKFINCTANNNRNCGIIMTASYTSSVKGTVDFENCEIRGNKVQALRMTGQQENALKVRFKNCEFDNADGRLAAFSMGPETVRADFAGVSFQNCRLNPGKYAAIEALPCSGFGILDITGDVTLPDGSQIDFKKFVADNQPDLSLREFAVAEQVDMTRLFPSDYKVAKARSSNPCMRGNFTFIQYIPEVGEYSVTFNPVQIGASKPQTKVSVKDSHGNVSSTFEMSTEPYTYRHKAFGKGIIAFYVNQRSHGMRLSSDCPSGLLANTRVGMIRGQACDFYFAVPGGLKEVKVEVNGNGTELVSGNLIDQAGNVLASCKNMSGTAILRAIRPGHAPAEVWSLHLYDIVEDHSIRFGEGIVPVASLNPNHVLNMTPDR